MTTNTLPNEPLEIAITEAGRENLILRAAAKEALATLERIERAGGQFHTERVQSLLRGALGEPEPQVCAGCGKFADAYDVDGYGECCSEIAARFDDLFERLP